MSQAVMEVKWRGRMQRAGGGERLLSTLDLGQTAAAKLCGFGPHNVMSKALTVGLVTCQFCTAMDRVWSCM